MYIALERHAAETHTCYPIERTTIRARAANKGLLTKTLVAVLTIIYPDL